MKQLLKNREEDWDNEVDRLIARSLRDPSCKPLTELKRFNKQTTILIFKGLIDKMEGDIKDIDKYPLQSTNQQVHEIVDEYLVKYIQQQIDYYKNLLTTLEI